MTSSNNKHKHKEAIMNTRLPLVLAQLHAGVYNSNTACAYIYYGDLEQQKTHEGKMIGTFISEAEQTKLNKHINQVIIPFVNDALSKSNYVTNGTDNLNMAPHTHIVIQRKDAQPITDVDLENIKATLVDAIQKRNKTISGSLISSFFQPSAKADSEATAAKTVSWKNTPEIIETDSLSNSDANDEEDMADSVDEPAPTHRYNLRSRK